MISEAPAIFTVRLTFNRNFPNSMLPVLLYKNALPLPDDAEKSSEIIKNTFAHNQWRNAWKNGIYKYHHYHSNTHECLGIAAGNATIIVGGPDGKKVELDKGDVLILPAGTGHSCEYASTTFVCVGAYPNGADYDIKYGKESELADAIKNLLQVAVPDRDPVYGSSSFLQKKWK